MSASKGCRFSTTDFECRDQVWSSSVMVMLTSIVSVFVPPASCSCVETSFQSVDLFRGEFAMCRRVHLLLGFIQLFFRQFLRCTCESLLERLRTRSLFCCLVDFSNACCGNDTVHGRLLVGNPESLLETRIVFSEAIQGNVSQETNTHHVALKTHHHVAHAHRRTCGPDFERLGLGHVCALFLDFACSFGLNLPRFTSRLRRLLLAAAAVARLPVTFTNPNVALRVDLLLAALVFVVLAKDSEAVSEPWASLRRSPSATRPQTTDSHSAAAVNFLVRSRLRRAIVAPDCFEVPAVQVFF